LDRQPEVIIPALPSERKKELKKSLLEFKELPTFNEFEMMRTEQKTEHKIEHGHSHEEQHWEVTHKIIRATCLIALIIWFCIIILLSIMTQSDPFFALIGLSPVLLTIIVSYILVDRYHLESGFLMIFPFIFTGILLMLGFAHMLGGIDYMTLSTVNIIFGVLFVAAITAHHGILEKQHKESKTKKEDKVETKVEKKVEIKAETTVVEKKPAEKKILIKLDNEEDVKKFVSSIEDKAKAINAVIGRVYSVRRGGTEQIRKKIRINASDYNEFNELKDKEPAKRKAAAVRLLHKISASLGVFEQQERELFDNDDMTDLVRLQRDADGKDKIIDVLVKNDSDPVKAYYDGAKEFCSEALKELEQ
jgi:hypothetical protein